MKPLAPLVPAGPEETWSQLAAVVVSTPSCACPGYPHLGVVSHWRHCRHAGHARNCERITHPDSAHPCDCDMAGARDDEPTLPLRPTNKQEIP